MTFPWERETAKALGRAEELRWMADLSWLQNLVPTDSGDPSRAMDALLGGDCGFSRDEAQGGLVGAGSGGDEFAEPAARLARFGLSACAAAVKNPAQEEDCKTRKSPPGFGTSAISAVQIGELPQPRLPRDERSGILEGEESRVIESSPGAASSTPLVLPASGVPAANPARGSQSGIGALAGQSGVMRGQREEPRSPRDERSGILEGEESRCADYPVTPARSDRFGWPGSDAPLGNATFPTNSATRKSNHRFAASTGAVWHPNEQAESWTPIRGDHGPMKVSRLLSGLAPLPGGAGGSSGLNPWPIGKAEPTSSSSPASSSQTHELPQGHIASLGPQRAHFPATMGCYAQARSKPEIGAAVELVDNLPRLRNLFQALVADDRDAPKSPSKSEDVGDRAQRYLPQETALFPANPPSVESGVRSPRLALSPLGVGATNGLENVDPPSSSQPPVATLDEMLVDRVLDRWEDRLRELSMRQLGLSGGVI